MPLNRRPGRAAPAPRAAPARIGCGCPRPTGRASGRAERAGRQNTGGQHRADRRAGPLRTGLGRPDDLSQEPAPGGLRLRQHGRLSPPEASAQALQSRLAKAPVARRHLGRLGGEGEWKITLEVFRDLGLAFGAACVAIYIILVWQTGSYVMPLVQMVSIPLDDHRHHARLLAAERGLEPAGRRLCRPGLLHRHGHDRHDRPGRASPTATPCC